MLFRSGFNVILKIVNHGDVQAPEKNPNNGENIANATVSVTPNMLKSSALHAIAVMRSMLNTPNDLAKKPGATRPTSEAALRIESFFIS